MARGRRLTDYEIGYGKPPKQSQFKKGVCANRRGRGKLAELPMREILDSVSTAKITFRERGKSRKASRAELNIRRLAAAAVKGDVESAATLLKLRAHAEKHARGRRVIQLSGSVCGFRDLPHMPYVSDND